MTIKTSIRAVGWANTTIGDAYSFTSKPRGLSISKPVPFIPMEAIADHSEHIDVNRIKFVESVSSGTYVENGDFILAKITPSFENGKQGFVDIDLPFAYATTEVIPIQDKKDISDKHFLAFWLRQPEIRSVLAGKMEGATGRQRLSKAILSNTEISLPSLSEQIAIVRVLMTIQGAILVQKKLISKFQELKRSMMQHLFTYGTKGEKIKITDIGEVPKSWHLIQLGKVCEFVYGKSLPKEKRAVGAIPVYGSNGAVGFHNTALVELSGIIIGRKGSVGLIHFSNVPFYPIDTTFYITEKHTQLNLKFLFYLLEHLDLKRLKADVGVPGINREMAYSEPVAVSMDETEQKKIADALDLIQFRIDAAKSQFSLYQDLFKTLLHELMSGDRRIKL